MVLKETHQSKIWFQNGNTENTWNKIVVKFCDEKSHCNSVIIQIEQMKYYKRSNKRALKTLHCLKEDIGARFF